jgi:hypothetical protein
VSDGFERRLELVGTGYRASTTATELTLNLGYSKPRILEIPKGIKVQVRRRRAGPARGRGGARRVEAGGTGACGEVAVSVSGPAR